MPAFSFQFHPAVICFGFLALAAFCQAGQSGDLAAPPWKRAIGVDEQRLPGKDGVDMFSELERGDPSELSNLAKSGNPLAAAILADYSRRELEDMDLTVQWLRTAVENGDADAAFALGELFFPLDGSSFGRKDFALAPDAVLGYVWYAIGLSGMEAIEKDGGETRTPSRQARDTVEGLRMLLLPSERARAAAILARWPDELPPDASREPIAEDRDDMSNGNQPLPDENAAVELIRRWAGGDIKDQAALTPFFRPSSDFVQILRKSFEHLQTLAEAGDEEAKYLVAWCRFLGLGVEADEAAALPVIEAKAEAGDPEAMFLMAIWFSQQQEEERVLDFAARAAEMGHGKSMLLLSEIWRGKGDPDQANRWTEKAAETGIMEAIESMIGVAESNRDTEQVVQWLTVAMIRTADPAQAYRYRMLIAYVGAETGEEALQKAMEAGERWHEKHPGGGKEEKE